MFVLTSFVSPVSYLAKYAPLFLPNTAAWKKWLLHIWAFWVAVYKIQSCMLLYLFWLLSETTNKQIHEVWFLPESAYQKSFPKIWASLYSYIQNSKLHALVFILASLWNNKQTNPWNMILAKICLPKLFSNIWAFVQLYTKFKGCTLLYVSWLLSETTNKQIHRVWFLPTSAS